MPRKKEEKTANLLFENGAYRVLDTVEYHTLLGRKEIIFEGAKTDKGILAHFYRKVNF